MTTLLKELNCNNLDDVINKIKKLKIKGDSLDAYILVKETRDYLYNNRNDNKNYDVDMERLLEVDKVKKIDKRINEPSPEEVESIASCNNVDLKYRWLLNEYCYGRTKNVKVLFESLRYNIVDLINTDVTTQESFKINLIVYLNEIDTFVKVKL